MRSAPPARFSLGIAALLLTTASAFASANVDCSIDDRFIKFEMEATAGRAGPINQVNVGTIEIKPAAMTLITTHITFDRTHIVQQWTLGNELRLQVEAGDDAAKQNVNLVIVARLNAKTDKYSGNYLAGTISRNRRKARSDRQAIAAEVLRRERRSASSTCA